MSNLKMRQPESNRATSAEIKRLPRFFLLNVLLLCGIGLSVQAQANTYLEVEPNSTCVTAQDLRSAVSPVQVEGYKTQPFGDAVDFFRFRGTAGYIVHATLNGDFTKPNPLTAYGVGFFTSDCPNFASGLAFTIGSEAQLDFTIPNDGEFVIGVTACCDIPFSGSGTIEGAYVLAVTVTPAPIMPAPISSTPAERSYGQWAAAFWQWVLGVPDNQHPVQSGKQRVNPLNDMTGEHCAEHQIGDVWFLAGTWVGAVSRSCTIPAGKSLFLPLINNVYIGFLSDPPAQRTEKWARDNAACTEPAVISFFIDGLEVPNPLTYFTGPLGSQSPTFNVQMPNGNAQGGPGNLLESLGFKIKQVPEWFLSPSAEQGYYLFFNPLPPGSHTLHWSASGCTTGTTQDVTYNLTVLGN